MEMHISHEDKGKHDPNQCDEPENELVPSRQVPCGWINRIETKYRKKATKGYCREDGANLRIPHKWSSLLDSCKFACSPMKITTRL